MDFRGALKRIGRPLARALPVALLGGLHAGANLRPIAAETFDREYGEGGWDWLEGAGEMARYAVIAGFVPPHSAVLDVGCGAGVLQGWLSRAGYRSYLGTDLSAVAIEQAQKRTDALTAFQAGGADAAVPSGPFDRIVFNEMLYHLPDPAGTLRRYAAALAPGGAFIISLWQCRASQRAWRAARPAVTVIDQIGIVRETSAWRIRLCRPA